MKFKIKSKVTKNPLTKGFITSIMRDEMLSISNKALPDIKNNLNSTEEPDPDPRRRHINVKKWKASIVSQHPMEGIGYRVLIRATNYQAPTHYIAFRTLKKSEPGTRRKRQWYDPQEDKILSREERDMVLKYARDMYGFARKIGYTPKESSAVRTRVLSRYKRLIPVKVEVDNIAFSRMFSARNTIKPNPNKYGPDNYSKCLKVWNGERFIYVAHTNPKHNNNNYYYSRVKVMTRAIQDNIGESHDKNQ